MPSLLVSVFLLPTLLLSLLVFRRIFLSVRPSELDNGIPKPPLMASWVPFLGNALDMASGDAFWTKAK